jgi:hypothetical protein
MDRLGFSISPLPLEIDAAAVRVFKANDAPRRAPFLGQRVGDHLRLLVFVHSPLHSPSDLRRRYR